MSVSWNVAALKRARTRAFAALSSISSSLKRKPSSDSVLGGEKRGTNDVLVVTVEREFAIDVSQVELRPDAARALQCHRQRMYETME